MEIEAKYAVVPADLDAVARLHQLHTYLLRPAPAPELQQNHYYDTADRRLEQARYGLRLREVEDRSLITLKGPAEVQDGLHRRAEYEFPHDNPDPRSWPAGAARELALALVGTAPLEPTLSIATDRRIIYAEHAGRAVAEICLDRSVIRAGERTQNLSELEIELLPDGDISDLAEIAAALREHVALVPEPQSKLQRGLALLKS